MHASLPEWFTLRGLFSQNVTNGGTNYMVGEVDTTH